MACFESHPANTSDGFNLDLLVFSPFEDELSQNAEHHVKYVEFCTWACFEKNLQGGRGKISKSTLNLMIFLLCAGGDLLNFNCNLLTYYQFEKSGSP